MSKVTYLWGAGASYGERQKDENGKITEFTRGLPVINELEQAIELLKRFGRDEGIIVETKEADRLGVNLEQYKFIQSKLSLLKKACVSYPTIDTLAKQLYITHRSFSSELDYEELKRILTTAFLMMQGVDNRDLRYDGFIASLINERGTLPPVTILSWNYDIQFEIAYSGYSSNRYIPLQWEVLNVFNKMYNTNFDAARPFAIIKLNGTALFTNTHEKIERGNGYQDVMSDCLFGGENLRPYQYGYNYLRNSNFETTLSYAWERKNMKALNDAIQARTSDTEELIVIGYSFPYVNNEIDTRILQGMPNLRKIVIQDLNFEDIKERIEGILEGKEVEIVHKKNLSQFYIPNRFL